LNVIHIISAPAAGGAEVFVRDLLISSNKFGIKSSVIFISSASDIHRSTSFEYIYLNELTKNNIDFLILRRFSIVNFVKNILLYKKFIKKVQPRIIHCHLITGIIYSKLSGFKLPLVYTHHSDRVRKNKSLFRLIMRLSNGFIGISQICSDNLDKYLPVNVKSEVIYNSLNEERIVAKKNDITSDKIKLLAVGRINEQKNYPLLIDAVDLIVRKYSGNICVDIAGEGDPVLLNYCINRVNEKGLNGVIHFLGNHSDIPSLMCQSDIFVMSSSWEGLPIALLEAQFTGLPAVVTDVGGCKEVIEATQGGIIVKPESPILLANAITMLLDDVDFANILSTKAKRNSSFFSLNNCTKSHIKFYEKTIQHNVL
jgi:glycosyltransferase involved in cell wall biosynthesis